MKSLVFHFYSNNRVVSKTVTKDGGPLLSLNQVLMLTCYYVLSLYNVIMQIGESYEVRVFTFKALTQVLKCAGDKKLKEVQLCLEGV